MKEYQIKICCIESHEEARLAFDAGANSLGLVSLMPDGPGIISEEEIAAIAAAAPEGVETVLLTSRTNPDEIVSQHQRTKTGAIQLCAQTSSSTRLQLRKRLAGIRIIQVVHVTGFGAVDKSVQAVAGSDAILLDSGGVRSGSSQLGGTGLTHDWALSKEIVERSTVPVYLAGGLKPGNVAEALGKVGPYGVDVCSGIRVNGTLNPGKLHAFIREVHRAGPGSKSG